MSGRLPFRVGTHLRLPRMEDVLALAEELERRYQAPANLGMVKRRADRVLQVHQQRWRAWIPGITEGVRVA